MLMLSGTVSYFIPFMELQVALSSTGACLILLQGRWRLFGRIPHFSCDFTSVPAHWLIFIFKRRVGRCWKGVLFLFFFCLFAVPCPPPALFLYFVLYSRISPCPLNRFWPLTATTDTILTMITITALKYQHTETSVSYILSRTRPAFPLQKSSNATWTMGSWCSTQHKRLKSRMLLMRETD